jgi:hypothetical protein
MPRSPNLGAQDCHASATEVLLQTSLRHEPKPAQLARHPTSPVAWRGLTQVVPTTRVPTSRLRRPASPRTGDTLWDAGRGVMTEFTSARRNPHTGGMSNKNLVGGRLVAIGHRRLWWATDAMLQTLAPETLTKLNVRAGEHLAAILTTAFLGVAPSDIDTGGGVDLSFPLPHANRQLSRRVFPAGVTEAAFEVKSLPGPHREWEHGIERDQERGLDATGRVLQGTIRRANDVLREALPSLSRASNQLQSKTSATTSRNAFLVVHPFDHMIIECIEHMIIGPLLDPLEGAGDLASVWVLWVPDHLTMWSRDDPGWIDLFFRAATPEEAQSHEPDRLAVLQEAEDYFLTRIGHTAGSPYLFGLSSAWPPAPPT